MNKILETSRCYLREMTVNDATDFFHLNEDKEVIKYTGDTPFSNIEAAENFLKNYDQYRNYGLGRWAVIDKKSNEFLGWCGLKYSPDTEEIDIGFRFFRKYWNQGYATETAKACLDYGFSHLQIPKIVGRAMEANTASVKVLEKIGMKFIEKKEFELHEGVVYELLNPKS